jgi:gas vesicle protein
MNEQVTQNRDYSFLAGLVIGGVVGVGVAMLLAPKAAAEIKTRAIDSAKNLGDEVTERYRDAKLRVSGAVDGLTRKGQGVRDGVLDTVARGAQDVERGAQEVERFATDAKTRKAG